MSRDAATGMPPAARSQSEAGYTLIEVMVVVFIIGLMTAVVGLSMSQPGRVGTLDRAEALARAVGQASREAIASGETLALGLRDGQPVFQRRRGGVWIDEAGLLRPRADSAEVTVSTEGEGRLRASAARQSSEPGAGEVQRIVWFSPLGEVTPAELLVSGPDRSVQVSIGGNGTARVVHGDTGGTRNAARAGQRP